MKTVGDAILPFLLMIVSSLDLHDETKEAMSTIVTLASTLWRKLEKIKGVDAVVDVEEAMVAPVLPIRTGTAPDPPPKSASETSRPQSIGLGNGRKPVLSPIKARQGTEMNGSVE